MDQTFNTLIRAKNLISDERRWLQGEPYVRVDVRSKKTNRIIRTTERFCLVEAIRRCSSNNPQYFHAAASAVCDAIGGDVLPDVWNDDPQRTHSEVMEALDRAIEVFRLEPVWDGPTFVLAPHWWI